jgi:hypothetical protein
MYFNVRIVSLSLILCFISKINSAQVKVSGKVYEESGNALPGAEIRVLSEDSLLITGTVSEASGQFSISVAPNKKYTLLFAHVSYFGLRHYVPIETKNEPLLLEKIILKASQIKKLKEVEVTATQVRGEQKGDTTAFNANAFKTNPDATAEDLIKKMPGVTSDNSGVKVNGESVQKVLVDGKPFFGDDPNATLKNIPSDIIDKVEIFDKMSDQSQFTGFNDGNQQKTINLVTKKGKNNGQFGRVYGGLGADESQNTRYNVGAALNSFKNKQRVSLLLLSNNVNQQNFSSSDITGAMGNSGQSGSGQQGGGMNSSSSLLTSPQKGNTTTQSAGLNYTDEWGEKINVSGSYFYNLTDNKQVSNISRNYFSENDLRYKQSNTDNMVNENHRFNFRFEYTIDSSNKLIVTPSLSYQNNKSSSSLIANNSIGDAILLSSTNTDSKNANVGYDFTNGILFQHKLKKEGRTISLGINTQLSERTNKGNYNSLNNYSDTSSTLIDQQFSTYGYTKKIAPNLSYTEPLNKYAQIQVSYNPSYTLGKSDKATNNQNLTTQTYSDFNTTLSNKYDNTYQTQKAGLSYRYRKDKLNLSFGADAQQSQLSGSQIFPVAFTINHYFQNVLPNAQLNYRFNKSKNLRINYRTNTNIPSITQLQNVLDISNPLQIKTGNQNLKQTFENNLNIRFGGFDTKTSRNAMLFINGNQTNNYVSNAVYILKNDSLIQGSLIKAGSQLTKPINLNGFYSARVFGVYGFPIKKLKSNFNVNGGLNYNHNPTLINDALNYSNSYATNAGVFLGSNISEKIDFSLSYNGNYTIVKNSVQTKSDNNYYTQTSTLKVNWIFLKGFVINSDVSHTQFQGLSQSFNQQYLSWNAYIGYKFLKNRMLEAKISVFDILNQNRSISRTISGAYTEDNNTSVLRRYALFTLTYTLKNFKSVTPPKEEERPNLFPGGRPPGMQRPQEGGG